MFGIVFLCSYAAWVCGGVHPSFQWPMSGLALMLCGVTLSLPSARARIRQDPIFWAGAVFLILLMIQRLNSGYGVEWGQDGVAVMNRVPSRWAPWSVDPAAAGQMLDGFFPAWTILLIIRHVLTRSDTQTLLYLLVWNSAALALMGLVQYLVGAEKIFGRWDVPNRVFFATFAYPNHAAEWFYLHAALSAGLLHDAVAKQKPPVQIGVWLVCFMLGLGATFLTLSRAGAFVALGLLLVVLSLFFRRTRKNTVGTHALHAYLAVAIIALAGLTLFLGAGGGSLAKEVGGKTLLGETSLASDFAVRIEQMPYAWEMIKEYPLFGTGAWGYGPLLSFHLPLDEWTSWMAAGKDNIHCDPLQFLSEFGIVGAVCMGWVLATLGRSLVSVGRVGRVSRWISAGILMVLLHSLIDRPFRSPAILLAWCSLWATLPILSRKSHASTRF